MCPGSGPKSPVAGGGRYDNLLADAGAPAQVPAVGSSIHTERLLAVLDGGAIRGKLILALPSKGRLMEQCDAALAKAGLVVAKSGPAPAATRARLPACRTWRSTSSPPARSPSS